jgi:hypothetical protein
MAASPAGLGGVQLLILDDWALSLSTVTG